MDDQLILDRYRLIERLATGGSAEVWRARDEQLDRDVAIKRLHPHLFTDHASRSRLASEARAAARLRHPGIVGIYDVDATGDAPAIVMELVEGESLATRIARDGPLPEAEAATVVADVADALFHAHQQGVIHRDVKPANILVASDGRARLVDFGIAHSLADASARLTQTGTVIGTLRSMAPEQLAGGPITPRTDLYGLGVVLHEALTGQPAFEASSPVSLADAQRVGPPAMEGVDPGLAAVVASCLAFQPERRPLHAGALADALRAWQPGRGMATAAALDVSDVTRPMPAVAPGLRAVPGTPSAAAAPPAHDPGPVPAAAPGRRLPLLVGALAAVLVVAAVVLAATRAPAVGEAPSPSAVPASVRPSPTPAPEWLADLLAKVEKDCGADVAAAAAPELAEMTEDEAEEHADELVDACKAEDEDRPGRGEGGGNRGGNGNGRGGGD